MAQIDFLGDPILQVVDGNGVPVQGGLIWCYDAESDNLRDMYSTISDAINQMNPIDNPYTLDASGRASIVYSGPSKFVAENSDIDPDTGHGSMIWVADNIGRFGNTVIDPNGNILLDYTYVSSANDHFIISNANNSSPILSVTGPQSSVNMKFSTKGSGAITFSSDSGSYSFPSSDGLSGTVLTTNGSGAVTFQPIPGVSTSFPPGIILDYAGGSIPDGWLLCNGSAVSRASFSDLFAAIGTTFGSGDGVNTFNLPNLSRRVRMGSGGTGTGTIGNSLGNIGGEENHSLSIAEGPSHTHTYTYTSPNYTPLIINNGTGSSGTTTVNSGTTSSVISTSTAASGSGTGHNTIQPSMILHALIKF
jgi:microcystin-dependent protein